jgi:hypothetical protein
LGHALRRLGILRFIGGNEQVKGHRRPLAVGRHPDRLEALFGLRLEVFGQLVQHIGRLMHPTPLPAGLPVHLTERLPKSQYPIPNSQGWRLREPAAFEVEEQFFPGLRALAVAIPEPDEFFLAREIGADNDENTMACCLKPGLQVHAVDPEIDVAFARQIPLLPLCQFFLPPLLQPAQRRRGEPRRIQ